MSSLSNPFDALKTLSKHPDYFYYSLPAFSKKTNIPIKRLPISIRIMLESLIRNCDGVRVDEDDVIKLAKWNAKKPANEEIPFLVSRVLLQDFTGVPLVVDLASMRDAVVEKGFSASVIEPQVPVDLVVDHSVQVDRAGTIDAFLFNLEIEFERNKERYEFLKWGQESFKTFEVVPPGIGIVHQVNLENIATLVAEKVIEDRKILLPDTLVGTDSHTPMVNGLGVLGWGVGGIEAEAAMLGQPVFLQMPEVIGVHLSGSLQEGVTGTDLTLYITELLRKESVVGKFVEFFGEGASSLTVADRATIGNMAPEYGATVGYFPPDEQTLTYLRLTGRKEEHVALVEQYLKEQGLFGIPKSGEIDFTKVLELNLSTIKPCVSGPRRPQDRINLGNVKEEFIRLLEKSINDGGYGKEDWNLSSPIPVQSDGAFLTGGRHETGGKETLESKRFEPVPWSEAEMVTNRPFTNMVADPGYFTGKEVEFIMSHGSIVIAAITSCTNTSNPSVMIGAGLLAKKAVEKGLKVHPMIKTSLAPGSRVVTDYLEKADLQKYLDKLGFHLVAYGCTTCIGNSGPLDNNIEHAIKEYDLVVASVLSGNRNFEARIHSSVKANFLMSPPLVVAFAIAGRIDINLEKEPLGKDKQGNPVFLKDIWPSSQEIADVMAKSMTASMFIKRYSSIMQDNPVWQDIEAPGTELYQWNPKSTYIQNPPYFKDFSLKFSQSLDLKKMRALAIFGDSVTTDHISPAGSFKANSPAGKYLLSLGVSEKEFNSYGSRRGNHEVMMRGTFANVRIRNKLADGKEGGITKVFPDGEILPIFDACQVYMERNVPLIIFAGKDYGMGSSRDWAAKGTALLGVKVVVARSFERIHRNNLIGMGVLPLQFVDDETAESIGIVGNEFFSIVNSENELKPSQEMTLEINNGNAKRTVKLLSRLDTPIEVEYYRNGGILPYVLRDLLQTNK